MPESQTFKEIIESLIPGEKIERYIENFIEIEFDKAINEAAATNLFVEKCIEEEKEAGKGNSNENLEKEKTKVNSYLNISEDDFDNKNLIEKFRYYLRESDHFLNRYMWIIALIWLFVVSIRWIGSATSSPQRKPKMDTSFRSSDARLLTRPAPAPTPFFPNYSRGIIDDYYYGNNVKPEELLQKSEISILMFYAPWSLHAQEAKKPFMDVAASFSFMPTVRFTAVNCFTKFGSCKKLYKLYSYPVFVGYMGKVQISYGGVPTAIGLFRFVKHLLDPADKISSIAELHKLMDEFEHIVVGYFPFENANTPPEYSTFIATALKSISHPNLFESTRFIIIQNPSLAVELTLDKFNRIRVLTRNRIESLQSRWNISTAFLISKHTKSDDILEWVKEKISQADYPLVQWLYLEMMESGGKSEILHSAISESNAVILFTTDYGNVAQSKSLKIIRDAAKAYNSCNHTTIMTVSHHKLDSDKIEEAQNVCRKLQLNPEQVLPCCQFLIKSGICGNKNNSSIKIDEHEEYCSAMLKVFPFEAAQKRCCKSPRFATKTEALFRVNWEDQLNCEWYRMMKRNEALSPYRLQSTLSDFSAIQGLGCGTNETVKFFAVGRKHSDHLLKKLNFVNETEIIMNDKLAIVSMERESIHLLDCEITAADISNFLIEFHQRKLKSVKLSEKITSKKEETNIQSFQKLNAIDFEQFLATKRKHDSVVFFTGGLTHGPSASIAYMLHTVASYFNDFNDLIKFYLIDASVNDLPYQYTFDRLPAIVFFPPLHSSIGGARYPHNLPVSVPNLLAFFLSRSQPELRWRIALASCSVECIQRNRLELHLFLSLLDSSIRKLRITRSHLIRHGHAHDASIQAAYVKSALHRRVLQRAASVHLTNVLNLLAKNDNIKNLPSDETNQIIKQSLFVRWILYNHFGI